MTASFYPGQIFRAPWWIPWARGQLIARIPDGVAEKGRSACACRSGKCSRNAGLSRRVVIIKVQINMEELLKSLQELLAIESVARRDQEKPFGNGVAQALDYHAFPTNVWAFIQRDADGLYGYAEIGEGAEIIGCLCPSGRGPRGRWLALSALCLNHRRRENAPTAARLGEARTPLTAP